MEDGEGNCCHVMGIVHGAFNYMPDLVEYFADNFPNLVVKQGVLGKSDMDTLSMSAYRDVVHKSYSSGTYRAGPLHQVCS